MRACARVETNMFSDATRIRQKETSGDPEGMPRAWKFGDVIVRHDGGTPCVVLTTYSRGDDPNWIVNDVTAHKWTETYLPPLEWHSTGGSQNFTLDNRYDGRNFLTYLEKSPRITQLCRPPTRDAIVLAIKKTLKMPAGKQQEEQFSDLFQNNDALLHSTFKLLLYDFIHNK